MNERTTCWGLSAGVSAAIEDYALIGDCETAALVSRDGSVDWLCWPRFDSAACFAALLGTREHGRWKVAPADSRARLSRRYLPETLILETTFETDSGVVTVTDFMPPRDGNSDLIRKVTCVRGSVEMHNELVIRFDYGSAVPWVSRHEDGALVAVAGPDTVMLYTDTPHHGEGLTTAGDFTVREGETRWLQLIYSPSHEPVPRPVDPRVALESTERFWKDWASQCTYEGPEWDAVIRSLITLKALTYKPTGGIVAAPTTSLPEHLGGVRNWDYRYCWLRDATLTLLALMDAGCYREADAWRAWLRRAAAGSPSQAQIMYGIAGERRLQEWEVDWLPGYEGSRPVRVGNAAYDQLQLDIFGEVMDALYQARLGGLEGNQESWQLQCALLEHLAEIWNQPDEGLWEVRGNRQHFTHSKVMAWVAFDRAIRSVEQYGLKGDVDRWRQIRREIHDQVCLRGFDPELNSFVQYYGCRHLDASLLMIPLVGFLPASDPRVRGTVEAVERTLMRDGLVLRYDTELTDDGLPPGEGAFLACSFWLADNYVLAGRMDDAEKLFQHLLSLRNDLGLLAEQYDPRSGRQLGNFPQAFSHVGLLGTAYNLAKGLKPAEQRSGEEVTAER